MKIELYQGNEAVAYGALRAGVSFYGGYPITPSSEIAEVMARELPKRDGVFIQMEDEIASLAACIGARLAGRKSMTATSGPGFSLMQEHLGYAAMAEVPVVIIDAMRGGPSTGLPTRTSQGDIMQARWGTHGDHPVVVLMPSTVEEAFYFTVDAVNISERLRLPAVVLSDEILSHMREKVIIDREVEIWEKEPDIKPGERYFPFDDSNIYDAGLLPFGKGQRYHVTGLVHGKDGFPSNDPEVAKRNLERFKKKIEDNMELLTDVEYYKTDDAEILFVAGGTAARATKEIVDVLRDRGIKIGLFRPKIVWPFPGHELKKFDGKVSHVIVPELNQGQLIYEVERHFKTSLVFGLNRYDGELFTFDELLDGTLNIIKS